MNRAIGILLATGWALLGSALSPQCQAESGTTNIINGVSTNAGSSYTLGNSGPFNVLIITNAGSLTDTNGTIGNGATANNNSATVIGTGSVWNNSGVLYVGYSGSSNLLTIQNGGGVSNSQGAGWSSGYIGYNGSSSDNSVLVTGKGSVLNSSTSFEVGYHGFGNKLYRAS